MDHHGETLFRGAGVTPGGRLSIHLDSRMARGLHLPFQPFVRHLRYFGSLKEVKAFAQLQGWFNYLLFFRAGWSAEEKDPDRGSY